MANKDYTYAQIKSGIGRWEYEENPQYSAEVGEFQYNLVLLGYKDFIVQIRSGLFKEDTREAVIAFQTECQLLPDGIVGKNTLVQMDKALLQTGRY